MPPTHISGFVKTEISLEMILNMEIEHFNFLIGRFIPNSWALQSLQLLHEKHLGKELWRKVLGILREKLGIASISTARQMYRANYATNYKILCKNQPI